MIISLLFGLASMIVALLGLKCIKIGSSTEQSKAKIAGTGGILSMLGGESGHNHADPCLTEDAGRSRGSLTVAGLCCIIAVSWYAYRVVQDFYDPFSGGMKSVTRTQPHDGPAHLHALICPQRARTYVAPLCHVVAGSSWGRGCTWGGAEPL